MAQHDYVIDNSTGANVRADINSVLQAISSNNSGSSAPSTTYAFQSFANTTDSMLQLRNAANNAFVNLRKFDGTLPLPDGSVSSPSLFFDDDTNTGIFSSAADTLNFTTGGVERMELGAATVFNEDGADVDFRIESDANPNMFKLDAGNSRVGIGLSTPTSILHIKPNVAGDCQVHIEAESANDAILLLDSSTGSGASADVRFAADGTTKGRISFLNAGSTQGDMRFTTGSDSEVMRLDSSGRLLLGTSTVYSATGGGNMMVSVSKDATNRTDVSISNQSSGDNASAALVLATHGQDYIIEATGSGNSTDGASAFRILKGTDERMRLDSSGNFLINCTDFPSSSVPGVGFDRRSNGRAILNSSSNVTTASNHIVLINPNGSVGTVTTNGSATSYNTSSDYRLKENATAISDGITRLKTLKPYRFNFKSDATTTVDGFFAHEVTAVPEAVTGTKDAIAVQADVDDGLANNVGDPIYQGIDQSKLVPLLVAAVQELIGKVEALETA